MPLCFVKVVLCFIVICWVLCTGVCYGSGVQPLSLLSGIWCEDVSEHSSRSNAYIKQSCVFRHCCVRYDERFSIEEGKYGFPGTAAHPTLNLRLSLHKCRWVQLHYLPCMFLCLLHCSSPVLRRDACTTWPYTSGSLLFNMQVHNAFVAAVRLFSQFLNQNGCSSFLAPANQLL